MTGIHTPKVQAVYIVPAAGIDMGSAIQVSAQMISLWGSRLVRFLAPITLEPAWPL